MDAWLEEVRGRCHRAAFDTSGHTSDVVGDRVLAEALSGFAVWLNSRPTRTAGWSAAVGQLLNQHAEIVEDLTGERPSEAEVLDGEPVGDPWHAEMLTQHAKLIAEQTEQPSAARGGQVDGQVPPPLSKRFRAETALGAALANPNAQDGGTVDVGVQATVGVGYAVLALVDEVVEVRCTLAARSEPDIAEAPVPFRRYRVTFNRISGYHNVQQENFAAEDDRDLADWVRMFLRHYFFSTGNVAVRVDTEHRFGRIEHEGNPVGDFTYAQVSP